MDWACYHLLAVCSKSLSIFQITFEISLINRMEDDGDFCHVVPACIWNIVKMADFLMSKEIGFAMGQNSFWSSCFLLSYAWHMSKFLKIIWGTHYNLLLIHCYRREFIIILSCLKGRRTARFLKSPWLLSHEL